MDTLDDFITSKFDIIPVSQLPLNRHWRRFFYWKNITLTYK
jgi:hypothetical protein